MRAILFLSVSAISAALVSIAAVASAGEGHVSAARHEGDVGPWSAGSATIRWRSEYVLRDATAVIDLAFPLPEGTVLGSSPNVSAVERNGRVVGLRLEGASPERIVAVTLTEPTQAGAVRLAPPLAAGDAVQIVNVSGDGGLIFEPDRSTMLERHVGFFAPADLAPSARGACDRAVGYVRTRTTEEPMYLQATPVLVADKGIQGAYSSSADRARTGAIGVGGAFVALLIGLGLLYRRIAGAAKVEQAESALEADFASLERPRR